MCVWDLYILSLPDNTALEPAQRHWNSVYSSIHKIMTPFPFLHVLCTVAERDRVLMYGTRRTVMCLFVCLCADFLFGLVTEMVVEGSMVHSTDYSFHNWIGTWVKNSISKICLCTNCGAKGCSWRHWTRSWPPLHSVCVHSTVVNMECLVSKKGSWG